MDDHLQLSSYLISHPILSLLGFHRISNHHLTSRRHLPKNQLLHSILLEYTSRKFTINKINHFHNCRQFPCGMRIYLGTHLKVITRIPIMKSWIVLQNYQDVFSVKLPETKLVLKKATLILLYHFSQIHLHKRALLYERSSINVTLPLTWFK